MKRRRKSDCAKVLTGNVCKHADIRFFAAHDCPAIPGKLVMSPSHDCAELHHT